MPGVVVQLTAEGSQPLRRGPADVAEAHQPHLAGGELRDPLHHVPLLHLHLPPRPDRPVPGEGVAQEHQHQQNGLLRHGAGVAALVIADVDVPLPGRVQVDAVIGHPLGVDQPQLRQPVHQ